MNFFDIGPLELLAILVVILLVFGPDKLGEFSRTVGKSMKRFRETSAELTQTIKREIEEAESVKKPEAPKSAPLALKEAPRVNPEAPPKDP